MYAAMHCEMSGMTTCTVGNINEKTGEEVRALCSLELHFNNCPSKKASIPACTWPEMFPKCENRIDFTEPIIKIRAYVRGKSR